MGGWGGGGYVCVGGGEGWLGGCVGSLKSSKCYWFRFIHCFFLFCLFVCSCAPPTLFFFSFLRM